MTTDIEPRHLVALLASPDQRVRSASVAALARHGASAEVALRGGQDHPDGAVRDACARLLAELAPSPSWAGAVYDRARAWWRRRPALRPAPRDLPSTSKL